MRTQARSLLFAAGLAVGLGVSSSALAFGIGVEGGGTATFTNFPNGYSPLSGSSTAGGAAVGIILENEFKLALIFFDLWADGQVPTLRLQTGGQDAAQYLPFDLGLRFGLAFAILHPYIGLLGQLAIPTSDGGNSNLNSPLFGIGGDIGLDLALFIFRIGIEIRGIDVLSSITNGSVPAASAPSGAYEVQGLGSVRLSF